MGRGYCKNGISKVQYDYSLKAIGGLTETTKMPCLSFGLEAGTACGVGKTLGEVPGTPCYYCYAKPKRRSGRTTHYSRFDVRRAHARRMQAILDDLENNLVNWIDAFTAVLTYRSDPFFRWMTSGDAFHPLLFDAIVEVSRNVPQTWFWFSTREYEHCKRHVKQKDIPDNLCIRVSSSFINGPAPHIGDLPVAHVSSTPEPANGGHRCQVYSNLVHRCPDDCRFCWGLILRNGEWGRDYEATKVVDFPLHTV